MTDSRPSMTSARSRMGTSNLGGVPTELADADDVAPALTLGLEFGPRPTQRHDVMPGVVLITGWLDGAAQRTLVDDFRAWSRAPAGLRHPRVPAGHLMTVQSVCLGWHWQPYAYSRTTDDTDGAPVKPIPADSVELARRAVADTFGDDEGARYAPDAVIANLYTADARLGLHQDGEEPSDAPVVTISLGDTCLFRMAGVDRRTAPFTDLQLESGDLLVFGWPSRRIYHGVPKVYPGTGPRDIRLASGRLSITVRETGLPG